MQGSLQTSSVKSASSASPTLCLQTWSVCLQYPRQQTLTCYQTLLSSVSQLHCRSDRTVVGWWYLWYGCWGLGSMPALPASWVGSSEAACTLPLPKKSWLLRESAGCWLRARLPDGLCPGSARTEFCSFVQCVVLMGGGRGLQQATACLKKFKKN